ncbi:MAG: hypothetical protein IKD35_04435, partial [Clostridia bacterium]|nr:hypothetical protein [Clostridia bacterium]
GDQKLSRCRIFSYFTFSGIAPYVIFQIIKKIRHPEGTNQQMLKRNKTPATDVTIPMTDFIW